MDNEMGRTFLTTLAAALSFAYMVYLFNMGLFGLSAAQTQADCTDAIIKEADKVNPDLEHAINNECMRLTVQSKVVNEVMKK
ncbi:hypothetical protein [Vogesella indigofera]|uniref:hypothetical protein n=1 Tax=Vogesella indigofera TaxID=45465 RepID=UPI00234F2D78|nr:hypothetical protein [Vogesella indigofera]MDC7699583.1 hypothetical protein [Vogesella indigofera]